jgi:hypothetical protein
MRRRRARQPQKSVQSSVLRRAPYSAIFQPSSDSPKGNKACGFLSSDKMLSTLSGHQKKEPCSGSPATIYKRHGPYKCPGLEHICPGPPPRPRADVLPCPIRCPLIPVLTGTRVRWERQQIPGPSYPATPRMQAPHPKQLGHPTPKLPTSSSLASPTSRSCGNHRREGRTILR